MLSRHEEDWYRYSRIQLVAWACNLKMGVKALQCFVKKQTNKIYTVSNRLTENLGQKPVLPVYLLVKILTVDFFLLNVRADHINTTAQKNRGLKSIKAAT